VSDRRSRRELLSGLFGLVRQAAEAAAGPRDPDPRTALYPPGAIVPAERFLEACTGCGDCVEACPNSSIVAVEAGGRTLPLIAPERKPCYLCHDLPCIAACREGALADPGGTARVRMGIARVDPRRCVTFRGQTCRLCFNACPFPNEAIMMVGGRPIVSSGACTGCGLCEYACPEHPKAIRIVPERDLVPGLRVPRGGYRAG